jgi:hypothetical protein
MSRHFSEFGFGFSCAIFLLLFPALGRKTLQELRIAVGEDCTGTKSPAVKLGSPWCFPEARSDLAWRFSARNLDSSLVSFRNKLTSLRSFNSSLVWSFGAGVTA